MNHNELKADLKTLADAVLTYITGPRRTTGYSYDRVLSAIRLPNVQVVIGLKEEEKPGKGRRATVPPGLLENLASLEHEQWRRWMVYMFNNLTPENVNRWMGQMDKDYAELTEAEKESDRMEARIIIQEILDYGQREDDAAEGTRFYGEPRPGDVG